MRGGRNSLAPSSRNSYQQQQRRRERPVCSKWPCVLLMKHLRSRGRSRANTSWMCTTPPTCSQSTDCRHTALLIPWGCPERLHVQTQLPKSIYIIVRASMGQSHLLLRTSCPVPGKGGGRVNRDRRVFTLHRAKKSRHQIISEDV